MPVTNAGNAQPGARRATARTSARALAGALAWAAGAALLGGCAIEPNRPAGADPFAELQQQVGMLQAELAVVRQGLADRGDQQTVATETLEARLASLQAQVDALPDELADLCPAPPPEPAASRAAPQNNDAPAPARGSEKLVVGELERVWLDPPGASLVAKVDAGVDASVLNAREVVVFERDGRRWVRFNLEVEGADEGSVVSVERPLRRTVRLNSPYESSGQRRPVVTLRLQLGEVREAVEVALVELDERDFELVLGRNFLTDLAVLDVSQKFLHPAFRAP